MPNNISNKFFDYAVNARASYGADAMNSANAPAVNGWTAVAIPRFVNASPDFSAQMYTDGNGNYRFSMRGSEMSNYGGDFRTADKALTMGQWDPQLADGIRFVGEAILQIKASDAGQNLSLDQLRSTLDGSGHSLGGAIYEAAASFWGLRGMSIDGPGVARQIESPEFQAIKDEFRARGLIDLRDSYQWEQGDFQARRYTVVGAAEIHADGVDVYTSPSMGALIDDMNATPSWAYGLGAGEKFAWETVASVAGHPMASIFAVEGHANVEAALERQRVLSNVAQGLSASGYEEGTVHYETLGEPVRVGAGSTAIIRQDALQITTYKDPVTGAIMEVRLVGRQVDGQFEAGTASASISGMDSAGRIVLIRESALALARTQLRTQSDDGSGDVPITVSAENSYARASVQLHSNGATSYEFVRESGDHTWVLENPETGARTVVVSVSGEDSDGNSPEGPRTLIYELNAQGVRTGQPRYYDEAGREVDQNGHSLGSLQNEPLPAGSRQPVSAFEDALILAFEEGRITAGPGSLYAMAELGIVSDAGGAVEPAASNPNSFTAYLEGAGADLCTAQQHGLANQLDSLNLGNTDALSFITLSSGTTLIQNADGDVVGEIQQDANGHTRVSATRINADGNAEPVVVYIDAQGQALTDQQLTQSQAQQSAAALGLLNSIIGLQNWDAMSDLQRTAALAGIYNAVDRITDGGTLHRDLGTAAGVLGLRRTRRRDDRGVHDGIRA